ncbi:MAG: AraC family ligand binding domain-containing protein, partial [Gemmatimonadaceae bacterium]
MPTHRDPSRLRSTFGRASDLSGLEYLRASYDHHRFAKHFHETFSIGLIESGANGFLHRGGVEVAVAGTLCAVNPGEVHTGGERGRWSYRNLYPSADLLRDVASQVAGRPRDLPDFRSGVINDPRAVELMRRLFLSLEERAPYLERESRLVDALGHLVIHHIGAPTADLRAPPEPTAVKRAREYLDAHCTENVSLAKLTEVTGRSPFHLLRLFRAAVGLPPHAYLMQRRLLRARSLVLAGIPLVQAAADAGFADQAHLTRCFRAVFGLTPG